MGIYNRDYLRDSYGGSGFGGGRREVVKQLVIANVVVFVLQLLLGPRFEQWVELAPGEVVYHGQVWRLLSYAFCHSPNDLLHILFNMLFLWWFGRTLEGMYGGREFLLFYLSAAVLSGVAFTGLGLALGDPSPAIGASGAVMAVVMVYAMYYPRQRIYIWGIFPIEIRWLVAAYVVFDLLPVLDALGGGGMRDGVAHSAHLGGLAFGCLYKKNGWRLEALLRGWRKPRLSRVIPRRKVRLYQPTKAELDERVDELLDKIRREGEASLTDEERQFLKDASRQYRDR